MNPNIAASVWIYLDLAGSEARLDNFSQLSEQVAKDYG